MKILVAGETTNHIFENAEDESNSKVIGSNADSSAMHYCHYHYD